MRGNKVTGWKTREIPLEHMKQGQILSPKIIGNVIRSTIKDLKGSKNNVISSISGVRTVHRILKVPHIPDKLLGETVERKARQEFAIPIEENDITWQVISRDKDQITLFVVAVQKSIIDAQVQALKEAKIKPRVLDIKPLALMRLSDQETSIVVNLEDLVMELIIIVNHVPVLVRSLPVESADLTPEAKADLLAQELARTAKYYNESHKTNRLPDDTPLFISGSLFATTDFESRLENDQSLIERFQNKTQYSLKRPVTDLVLPKNFPLLRYAVNLGLGIKNSK